MAFPYSIERTDVAHENISVLKAHHDKDLVYLLLMNVWSFVWLAICISTATFRSESLVRVWGKFGYVCDISF